ncbi:MAG: hypothetical protein ACLP50_11720 [Solirubrobacteraceae bacterium]
MLEQTAALTDRIARRIEDRLLTDGDVVDDAAGACERRAVIG